MTAGLTALCFVCFGAIRVLPLPLWLFGLLYLLGIFVFDAMIPLMNALSVAFNQQGRTINYGLGRGMGAIAYSAAALGFGRVMADWGADWMPTIALLLLAVNALIILCYPKVEAAGQESSEEGECCSLPVFLVRYKWFCLSLVGVMLLAMYHIMTENYLIEVVKPLGGDSGSVGIALFVATVAELPIFMNFERIRRYVRDETLLKIAAASFLLKSLLIPLAPGVTAIYLIQLLQATSYTLLSPTQLYYAGSRVSRADMVKGQAFITAAYTLGCAAGNFAGGQLLKFFGLGIMLRAGVVMAAAGAAVLFFTVERRDLPTSSIK